MVVQEQVIDAERTADMPFDGAGGAGSFQKWLPLVVVGAGLWVYLNSFSGVFLFDDQRNIVNNEHIRQLWPIDKVLTSSRRPVLNLSLAVNYAISGLDVWSYHAFNLAVHILAALILFGVVRRTLLQRDRQSHAWRASSWLALTTALIWVVHPLLTQSVTYVIQRSESMMGLFYLLTLYCVIRGVDSRRRGWWYVSAVVSCALGMGCKAVMVTAPVVILLYDRVFLSNSFRETLRRRWALYVGLVATLGLLFPFGVISGVLDPSKTTATVGLGYQGATPLEYALTQPGVIVHYLWTCFWPLSLCLDYDWPITTTPREFILPVCLIVVLVTGALWALLRRSWIGFVGMWFFLILSPTSSVIPIRHAAFEHRMYLPLAAVVVLVVVGGWRFLRYLYDWRSVPPTESRWVSAIFAVTIVVALGVGTMTRNRVYHSQIAMWSDIVAKQPRHANARSNLGAHLAQMGKLQEGLEQQEKALELAPEEPGIHSNLGTTLLQMGRVDEAISHLSEALRLDPKSAEGHLNLASALLRKGELDDAVTHYVETLRIRPNNARAHDQLGVVLFQKEDAQGAIAHLTEALRLEPDSAETHDNFGMVLRGLRRFEEAEAHFVKVLQFRPRFATAHHNLATVLYAQGRFIEAIVHWTEALRLEPNLRGVRYNRGRAFERLEKLPEAINDYRAELQLNPGHTRASEALERALKRQNR